MKGGEVSAALLQKIALLGMARILEKVFGKDVGVQIEGETLCPGFW